MKLPNAPQAYDSGDQARMRSAIQETDNLNVKRNASVTYLLMSKPDGTVGKLTIDDTGSPIWTAL